MHTDVVYKCEVCEQAFVNKDVLYGHCLAHVRKKQKDTSNDKEQFTCDICSKHFKTKAGVRSHMLLHTGQHLMNLYVSFEDFNAQVFVLILSADVFDYVCDQCGWRFQVN